MSLKHADIWRAIDRLAERHNLSPSGLARKAGLSPTLFNPSKRYSKKRERWPSTESIARILQATRSDLDAFVALAAREDGVPQMILPVLDIKQAARKTAFTTAGIPSGKGWEQVHFPALTDRQAFILEITGKSHEPVYRKGDRIVISPAEKPRMGDRIALRRPAGEIMLGELMRENAKTFQILTLDRHETSIRLARRDILWMYRIVWVSQ